MHEREHPWHIRRVSHRHLHDQRNLLDLHFLTHSWGTPNAEVENPFDREPSLEDDTSPEDVIRRLEHEVRDTQIQTLSRKLGDAAKLDELSYQAGNECASRRWTEADPREGSIAPADKRALLLALCHGPLSGRLGAQAFLVRRALVTEVTIELLQCPHRLAESKDLRGLKGAPSAEALDELCRQQFQWLRGYFNFLNPAITPALSRPRGRCVVSW
jgi:hypothetical protein